MRFLSRLLIVPLFGLLTHCAGYQLGGSKPSQLAEVNTLFVPTFENLTLLPRVQVAMTNAAVDQLTTDATYRVVSADQADAILKCRIQAIDYSPLRFARNDSLRPQELSMSTRISYQVIDSTTQEVLLEGRFTAQTNTFIEENFQLTRASGVPDLARRSAINLVSRITHGL